MDKNTLDKKISKLKVGSKVILEWDRGNGPVKKECTFKGYDAENNDKPLLYPSDSPIPLDLSRIGYRNITSIKLS